MSNTPRGRTASPHGLRPVVGRHGDEGERASTPLELFYDLTVVVAVATAGECLAEGIGRGDIGSSALAYLIAGFAIFWAWTSFSVYASAFDNDDVAHRLLTMVQMVGVVIMALGIPPLFESLHEPHADNSLMVVGYVVMRVGMIAQWLRVAHGDPTYAATARRMALATAIVQVGWIALAIAHTPWPVFVVGVVLLGTAEVVSPMLLQRRQELPWNPHHVADRFAALAIITLGEGVVGSVAALSSSVQARGGWTLDAVVTVVAGIVLTFGLWWSYFTIHFADLLDACRAKLPAFIGFHFLIMLGLAATGAGLQVAGMVLAGEATIAPEAAIAALAVPVLVAYIGKYGLYTVFVPEADPRHVALLAITLAILGGSILMAHGGVPTAWCLSLLMLAPLPTIIGYEWFGHDHQDDAVGRLRAGNGRLSS